MVAALSLLGQVPSPPYNWGLSSSNLIYLENLWLLIFVSDNFCEIQVWWLH